MVLKKSKSYGIVKNKRSLKYYECYYQMINHAHSLAEPSMAN